MVERITYLLFSLFQKGYDFTTQSSVAEKTVDELTFEDVKEILRGLWAMLSTAFQKKYDQFYELWMLKGGFEWFLPLIAVFLYIYIRKMFKPPDVERLKNKKKVSALIRALSYKRSQSAVSDSLEEDYKENLAVKIRCGAAAALGTIGDPRSVYPLITALTDNDKYVRMNTVRALSKFPDQRVHNALIRVAEKDPDEFVQFMAQDILEEKGWKA